MLLPKVERFLRQSDIPAARFGRDAVGDPCFVFDLRSGREPRSGTVQRVLAYIDAHRADEDARHPTSQTIVRCGCCGGVIDRHWALTVDHG